MSNNTQNTENTENPETPETQETQENNLVSLLINSQQEAIVSLKLNLKLIDAQIPPLSQAVEYWKSQFEELEKKYLELEASVKSSQ